MYIQLIDKDGFKSSVLNIFPNAEEEFLTKITLWKEELLLWSKEKGFRGTPLGRLEAQTCMVDLIHYLTKYFVKSSDYCDGRIVGTMGLINTEELMHTAKIIEIKVYE